MKDALRQRRRQQLKKAERQARRQEGVVDSGAQLERLRGLLYEAPSARGWSQLTEAVEAWPSGPELEVALGYLSAHLEGWPDGLRVTEGRAWAWYKRAVAGLAEPRFGLVRSVRLPVGHPLEVQELRMLGSAPWARGVSGLEIARPLAPELGACVEELSEGALTSRLARLRLEEVMLGAGEEALLGRLSGASLRELGLVRCGVTDAGLGRLARSAWPALEVLELGASQSTAAGWASLSRAPWRSQLRELRLRHEYGVRGASLRRLLASPEGWPRLEVLQVAACALGPEDARSLAGAELPQLRVLDVTWNQLGVAGVEALVRAAQPREVLAFEGNELSVEEIYQLIPLVRELPAARRSLLRDVDARSAEAERLELILGLITEVGLSPELLAQLERSCAAMEPEAARRTVPLICAMRPHAAWPLEVRRSVFALLPMLTVPGLRAWLVWRGAGAGLSKLRRDALLERVQEAGC